MSLILPVMASWAGYFYLQLVGKSSFDLLYNDPQYLKLYRTGKPFIYCFWHNTQVYLAYAHRGEHACVVVSRSKDGEYIAQVMNRLKLKPIRGSSSRGGGKALLEVITHLEEGYRMGFTPDGPKGPVQSVQPGVVAAAQKTGLPVVSITAIPRRRLQFNSWDKFMVPLPFGVTTSITGQPVTIAADEDIETAKDKVRRSINGITKAAHELNSNHPSWIHFLGGEILFWIYNLLTLALIPLLGPVLMFKYGFKRSLASMKERLGFGPQSPSAPWKIWFHVASVGEWQALRPLLKQFLNRDGCDVMLTTTTPEARLLVLKEFPDLFISLLPIDNYFVMQRYIQRHQPDSVVIVETELWPNLIQCLRKKFIPVFMVNARLSKRSVRNWLLAKPFIAKSLRNISWFFVRSHKDGEHFARLGAPVMRLKKVGNMKNDNLSLHPYESKMGSKVDLFKSTDGVVVIGGSTWPGEERILLKLFSMGLDQKIRLILAPRRMERIDEVEKLIQGLPLTYSRYSGVKQHQEWTTDVLLVDTLGDLIKLYAAADIAFIGGSVYPKRGQNPLEPAAAGVPMVCGPSMDNFEDELNSLKRVEVLRQGRHEKDILTDIKELICDPNLRKLLGETALNVVRTNQGASQATYELLCQKMGLSE